MKNIHKQYATIKKKFPDCLLIIRIGEYYESFFQDAERLAAATEFNLYTLDYGKICGFKYELLAGVMDILNGKEIKYKIIEEYKNYV